MSDPGDVVLLLVDLQEPILARSRTVGGETIRTAASVLVRAAKLLSVPVVVSVVSLGDRDPSPLPEIAGAGETFVRSGPNPFDDPATLAALKGTGRPVVAIGAVLTEVAGFAAGNGALREGFAPVLLADACGGFSARTEDAVFSQLRHAGARVLPVASFLADRVATFRAEPGRSLLPLMRETYGAPLGSERR